MELHDYLRSAWRRLPLIAVVAVAVIILGTIGEQPAERYRSQTQVVFSFGPPTSAPEGSSLADRETAELATLAEVATSAEVLAPVVSELGLSRSASDLAGDVTVRVLPGTLLLQVVGTSSTATEAETLSTAVASSLVAEAPRILPQVAVSGTSLGTEPATSTAAVSSTVREVIKFGVVGVVLGLGLSVLIDTVDPRIRNRRDLARLSSTLVTASAADAGETGALAARLAVRSPTTESRVVVVVPTRAGTAHESFAEDLARGFVRLSSTVLLTHDGETSTDDGLVVRALGDVLPSSGLDDVAQRVGALREEFGTVVIATSSLETTQIPALLARLADVCVVAVEVGTLDKSRFGQILTDLRDAHPGTIASVLIPRQRLKR